VPGAEKLCVCQAQQLGGVQQNEHGSHQRWMAAMRSCSGRLAALELHYCSCMAGQADGMVEAVWCGLVSLKVDASPGGTTTDSKNYLGSSSSSRV
jgi:hypothetical protein